MAINILVVEDDHGLAELACIALREGDFDVERVPTDLDAYRRLTSLPTIDALVQDVDLGNGTTGYDVARFARQVIPDIVVIYVSRAVEVPAYRVYAVPDSLFLQKPFGMDSLMSALRSRLSSGGIVCSSIH